jgi:hypothetical protein
MTADLQTREIYVYFYARELLGAIYSGESPRETFACLSEDFRQMLARAKCEIEALIALREKKSRGESHVGGVQKGLQAV